jgi:cell division protein FtsB
MDTARSDEPNTAPVRSRVRRRLTAQEVRDRRRRIATWVFSLFFGVLLVNSLVGENGYFASIRAGREAEALRADVYRIRLENQELQRRAHRLEEDPLAVEEAARRDLGFLRPGETVVVIRDVPAADGPRSAR